MMGNLPSKEEEARIAADTQAELARQTASSREEALDYDVVRRIRAQRNDCPAATEPDSEVPPGQPSVKLKRSSKSQTSNGLHKRPRQQAFSPEVDNASAQAQDVKEESASEGEIVDSSGEGPVANLINQNAVSTKAAGSRPSRSSNSAVAKNSAPAVQDPGPSRPRDRSSSFQPETASGGKRPQPPPLNTRPTSGIKSAFNTKQAATNAFADERRPGLAQLGRAHKRSSAASVDDGPASKKVKAGGNEKEAVTTIDERPPRWYNNLRFDNSRRPQEAKTARILEALKADIRKTQESDFHKNPHTVKETFNNVRRRLHEVPFEPVSEQLLRNNRMLHNENGLPVLFEQRYPWDIRADAQEQYNKWCLRIFETDLLHHITRGVPRRGPVAGSSQDTVDRDFRKSAKFFGDGLLLNGQWWPTQLTVFRDGAHGETIKGISGSKTEGAYSCIMSGGTDYDNKKGDGNDDMGDVVLYCGMDSSNGSITEETQMLMRNEEGGSVKPVRFIRSHQCPNKRFAPEIGFRYDGLYEVVSHERIDPDESVRQRIRFKLVRMKNQDPIRAGPGPEKRPTEQEMDSYKKDKRMRGFT